MGFTRGIGRIGPLAVALGVGLAVATTPGIALAEPSESGSSSAAAAGSSGSPGSGDGAAPSGSDGTESSGSGSTEGPAADAEDADTEADAVDVDVDAVDDEDDDAGDDVVEDDADDVEVADDASGAADADAAEVGEVGEEDTPPAADSADTQPPAAESESDEASPGGDSADPETTGGSDEPAATESEPGDETTAVEETTAGDETDQAAAATAEISADSDQRAAFSVSEVSDSSTTPLAAAPTSAADTTPAAAASSEDRPTPLKDLADGVVRGVAQVVVDVLDWALAASGTSHDAADLPWGLAVLAWMRREVDQTFLAPYRDSQQANALLAAAQSPNLLANPGAEVGDPSLSGNSAVSIPGWTVQGTPTTIEYGTLRNVWPIGLSFPMPDMPWFMGFPWESTGPPDGGAQFFGGGNVADANLTQTVDLSAAAADIDTGDVTYELGAWLGGYLWNLSSASVKVDFLDENMTYLDTASIGPVGPLDRFFGTKFRERETSGSVPTETRYAQVDVILDQHNVLPLGTNIDYNSAFADNISFTISSNLPAPADPTPLVSTVGELDHVFMVYMENKGYNDILGSEDAPFLNSLINAYGFADNYYGLTHPSLPNYYPVIGGTDYGLTYECTAVCIFDHGPILTTNIDDAGMTWRGYAQSQPPGQPLEASGDYDVDQLPFIAFEGIGNDQAYAEQHLFPLDQMAIDLSSSDTAPDYAWFAANENFNGEGPIDSLGDVLKFAWSQITPGHQYNVPALDQFLSETVPVIMNSTVWEDPDEKSVLVVTFDEDNDNLSLGFGDEGNRVVTVVIPSPAAVAGGMRGGPFIATEQYDHYSLLRMIEDSLGLPTMSNNDKFAVPMNEFWT